MPCILYFDDDPTARMILHHLLQARGISVVEAGNVHEAWEVLYHHPEVDMICLDHQLGTEMGWQWLATLRSHPLLREIPVVVLTAQAEREDVLKYVGMGVLDFLLKRPDMQKLENALTTAMGKTWRHRLLASEKRTVNPAEIQDKVSLLEVYIKSGIHDDSHKILLEMHRQAHTSGSFILESLITETIRSIRANIPLAISKSVSNLMLYGRLIAFIEGVDKRVKSESEHSQVTLPQEARNQIVKADTFLLSDWELEDPLARTQITPFITSKVEERLDKLLTSSRWKVREQLILDLILGMVRVDRDPQQVFNSIPSLQLLLSTEASSALKSDERQIITVQDIISRFGADRIALVTTLPTLLVGVSRLEQDWWVHNFATGWMAAELQYQARSSGALNLPLAGILHDLGKIMLFEAYPSSYRLLWTLATNDKVSVDVAEKMLFGLTHAQVAGRWLEAIGHPALATASIWHEDPIQCPAANIVHDLRFLRAADLMMRGTGRSQPGGPLGNEVGQAFELLKPLWPVFTVIDLKHRLKEMAERTAKLTRSLFKASRNSNS